VKAHLTASFIVVIAGVARAADPADEKPPIVMGIGSPNGEAHAASAKPQLEAYLSKVLKRPVRVQIAGNYDDLTTALVEGKVDLAWITPVAFVKASTRSPQVTALAKAIRGGNMFYRAAFMVRKDSPAKTLDDVKGKRVAWVSRSSASGYIFPRALLKSKGEDPSAFFSAEALSEDHPSVCKAVRDGKADVGATFADEPAAGQPLRANGCADAPPIEDFRVIASSGPIPNDVIAIRPDFDERLVNAVLKAFARMDDNDAGRAILKDAFRVDGWGVAIDGDFQTVLDALDVKAPAKVVATDDGAAPAPAKSKKK
jgi:phosphate/phosphite/phosphonate ABC transporter binding protein